jgi:hypothetical protein
MATIKKVKKYQKSGPPIKKKVPETSVVGDDLSISNAVRRIRKNPKDPDNLINQAMRLNPITQLARAGSEAITRTAGALGNKKMKKENARRDSIYNAQKKELQKDKKGGVVKKAKTGKQMIKRADGSVSQRGLWDNIRAAKGSGKKPTAEMLKQEKKIKAKTSKKK